MIKIFLSTNTSTTSEGVETIFYTKEQALKTLKSIKKETSFALKEVFTKKLFNGEKYSFFPILGDTEKKSLILTGLGDEKKLSISDLRKVSAGILRTAKKIKTSKLYLKLPSYFKKNEENSLKALLEGLLLADYDFKLKSKSKNKPVLLKIYIENLKSSYHKLLKNTLLECSAVTLTRDFVNRNADDLTPEIFMKEAIKIAKTYSLKHTVLKGDKLKKKGLNLLYSVGKGANTAPNLTILEYKGGGKASKTIALIGKGITFDSGGLNLKPSGHIEDMRQDMAGAACVLGTIQAIASLKLKINVIAVMALAENAIGSNAYKPGDIIKAYNGKTVEVLNTDAEGRLALADALSFTEKNYKPDCIIDLATLTGAVLVALGEHYAALMTQDEKLKDKLLKAAKETDDKLWPLPLTEEYMPEMKSDIADLRNIAKNRNAGTIHAAVFLSSFIKKTSWAHIDIAGTGWSSGIRNFIPKYATGYGVRMLTNFCKNFNNKNI